MSERLEISGLTVRFGSLVAVDDVSLVLEAGSVLGLVGESGSGKSTVARSIVGLVRPESGSVRIGDVELISPRSRKHRAHPSVQMIFQNPRSSFNPRLSIGDSLLEVLSLRSGTRGEHRARINQLLDEVNLDAGVADLKPGVLSGGQLQRAAIARALAAEPTVLIADEITSSLDVSVQAVVLNLLRTIQDDEGLSILFISHNMAVVRYVSDEIAVMRRGRILEHRESTGLLADPEHAYTRELLAAVPRIGANGSTDLDRFRRHAKRGDAGRLN